MVWMELLIVVGLVVFLALCFGLFDLGVDGICSNRPDVVRRMLG